MKKFILVMVFVFITALFIAFNYLLWDRESKITDIKTGIYKCQLQRQYKRPKKGDKHAGRGSSRLVRSD